jgi:hypothetical protein
MEGSRMTEDILQTTLSHVTSAIKLIEGNEYEQYMNLHLTSVYYEIKRQLTNLEQVAS